MTSLVFILDYLFRKLITCNKACYIELPASNNIQRIGHSHKKKEKGESEHDNDEKGIIKLLTVLTTLPLINHSIPTSINDNTHIIESLSGFNQEIHDHI